MVIVGSGYFISALPIIPEDGILLYGMWRNQSLAVVFSRGLDKKFLVSSDGRYHDGISVCFYSFAYFEYSYKRQNSGIANSTVALLYFVGHHDSAMDNQEWNFLFYWRSCNLRDYMSEERSKKNRGIYTSACPYGV